MHMDGSPHEHKLCCHEPPRMVWGLGVKIVAEYCPGSTDEGGTIAMFVLALCGFLGVVGVRGFESGPMLALFSFVGICGGSLTGSGCCGMGGRGW
jgi:hypothetical protein